MSAQELKPHPQWTVEVKRWPLGETGDYESVESLLRDGEIVASRDADAHDDDYFEEIAAAMNRRADSPSVRVQAAKDKVVEEVEKHLLENLELYDSPLHKAWLELDAAEKAAQEPKP